MKPGIELIEFRCRAEDEGVIAAPVQASAVLPVWLRQLPGADLFQQSATNNGLTVKRCVPFLDALAVGWVIPLAAEVRLEITDEGKTVNAGWEFDRVMVSNHSSFQVAGNPWEPRPPMKFHNYWTIRTPPGWSCLITAPLNRYDDVVHVFSGVVDTDTYTAPINFPFVATAPDGVHVLLKGRPLAQVIPFLRTAARLQGSVGPESAKEANDRERVHRSTLAGSGWYRRLSRTSRRS